MIIVKHHNKNILFFKLKNIQWFASVVYLSSLHVRYDKNLKNTIYIFFQFVQMIN